jgi:hypothetical protein
MTDTTLAERLARCVKPLRLNMFTDDVPPDELAEYQAAHVAIVLAALDMDALAKEVEAMVGEETERCIAALEDHFPGRLYASNRTKAIAAIRAREGGKP